MKTQAHNRQLPLAQKYERQILSDQMRGNEKIIAEQCMAQIRPQRTLKPSVPKTIEAGIVVHVATCMKSNPGPGAWAATIVSQDGDSVETDYRPSITGPLLELEAMIAALTVIEGLPGRVALQTTAKWIAEYLNDGRTEVWRANGWRKSSGDRVKNRESWAELLQLHEQRQASITWGGHDETPEMRRCSALAGRTFHSRKSLSGGGHVSVASRGGVR